jgi:hypothetical protein
VKRRARKSALPVAGLPPPIVQQIISQDDFAPRDAVFEKTVSNMQEVAARGGRLILIGDQHAAEKAGVAIEQPMPGMAVNSRRSRCSPPSHHHHHG